MAISALKMSLRPTLITSSKISRCIRWEALRSRRVSSLNHVTRNRLSDLAACQQWSGIRHYSSETIPSAQLEGDERQYTPKIKQLVDDIGQLTLLEVADLNELLKKTLKISDTPVMAMGAAPAASMPTQEEEELEVKQEKVAFTVKLTAFDASKKVALIKEVKSRTDGMNLVQAKKFVESLPQSVKSDITKEESETLKAALEAAGGTVVVD